MNHFHPNGATRTDHTLKQDRSTRGIPARKLGLALLLALALLTTALSGCASGPAAHDSLEMAPMSMMPEDVQAASMTAQQAYQFAFANPHVLEEIPCYCGCGSMGHTSNYDCYVSAVEGEKIIYDAHALGCSICVDITQDTMRLLREGKTTAEIKTIVDETYSRYGPTNMEP